MKTPTPTSFQALLCPIPKVFQKPVQISVCAICSDNKAQFSYVFFSQSTDTAQGSLPTNLSDPIILYDKKLTVFPKAWQGFFANRDSAFQSDISQRKYQSNYTV